MIVHQNLFESFASMFGATSHSRPTSVTGMAAVVGTMGCGAVLAQTFACHLRPPAPLALQSGFGRSIVQVPLLLPVIDILVLSHRCLF